MKIFESAFPNDYRKEEIGQILDFVTKGKFCQFVCVPGGGKATMLRILAHNRPLLKFHLAEKERNVRFIYLNLLELPSFDEAQIYKFLLLSLDEKIKATGDPLILLKQLNETVNKLAVQNQTLVFLFDHFDEFHFELHRSFFRMLRGLKEIAKYKFAAVFATRRDLRELIDQETLREFYDFFIGNGVYLKINDKNAQQFLFTQIENVFGEKLSPKQKENIANLTCGHAKLTKVIAETVLKEKIKPEKELLLNKPIVKAALFELWLFLTAQEQHLLTLIAQKKRVEKDSTLENLIKMNLLREDLNFTVPLFEDFITAVIPTVSQAKITYSETTKEITKGTSVVSDLLSSQEYRLLKFMLQNQNRILERSEIIEAVWPEAKVTSGISDEAIDQMVFRLRKKLEDEPNNPKHLITVKGQGFRFIP